MKNIIKDILNQLTLPMILLNKLLLMKILNTCNINKLIINNSK